MRPDKYNDHTAAIARWLRGRAASAFHRLRRLVRDNRDATIIGLVNEAALLTGAAGLLIHSL